MISVIIPVYNGERFIRSCYQSLLYQTVDDWEAVFIDDGSCDGTYSILDELSEQDIRVKVIHKENEGVAIAREAGLKVSNGEIITFLDVDDTLNYRALEYFLYYFDNDEVDIVVGGINLVREDGDIFSKINYRLADFNRDDAIACLCDGKIRWQIWAKAFRAEVLECLKTPAGIRNAEDMVVCLQAFCRANRVKTIPLCVYNYIQVSTSVTHAKALEISTDALNAAYFIERKIGRKVGRVNLDCMFLLILSGGLRAGIDPADVSFRKALTDHFNFRSVKRIPLIKGIALLIYRYCRLNLSKFV